MSIESDRKQMAEALERIRQRSGPNRPEPRPEVWRDSLGRLRVVKPSTVFGSTFDQQYVGAGTSAPILRVL